MRAALVESDALLAGYVRVILCKVKEASNECDAERNDDSVVLISG